MTVGAAGGRVLFSKEERNSTTNSGIPRAASPASRDTSAAAHARTRGRVPNNRLPLSLGMLRTATGLQIVPTLRAPHSRCQEISQGFSPVVHRHTERAVDSRLCVSGIHVARPPAAKPTFFSRARVTNLAMNRPLAKSPSANPRTRVHAYARTRYEKYRSTVDLVSH